MSKILFEDKVALRELNLPRKNTITADDINEVKASVNALYDLTAESVWILDFRNALSISFVAGFDFAITADEYINGSPAVTYEVNGNPYSFDEVILKGAVVSISVDVNSVVVIAVSAEKIDNLYFQGGATGVNIYNSNGVLDSNRDVDLATYALRFFGGDVVFGDAVGTGFLVEINGTADNRPGLAVIGGDQTGIVASSTTTAIVGATTDGIAVNGQASGSSGLAGRFEGAVRINPYGIPYSNEASAIFQVDSTDKGVLIPSMTTTQRNSIPSPATRLQIWNSQTARFEHWNGTYWAGQRNVINIFHGSYSPANSTTASFGAMPISPQTAGGVFPAFDIVLRGSGVIRACTFNAWCSGTVGTGENWSLYIRHNSTDYLVASVGNTNAIKVFSNSALNIPYVDGDTFKMIYVNPTTGTRPSGVLGQGTVTTE